MQFGIAFWESVAFFLELILLCPFKTHLETYLGIKKHLNLKNQDYSKVKGMASKMLQRNFKFILKKENPTET